MDRDERRVTARYYEAPRAPSPTEELSASRVTSPSWPSDEHERTTARAFPIPDYAPQDEHDDGEDRLRHAPRSSSPELLTPALIARLGDRLAEHSYDELEIEVITGTAAAGERLTSDELDEAARRTTFALSSDAFGAACEEVSYGDDDSIDIEIFRGEADDSLHDTMTSALPDALGAGRAETMISARGDTLAGAIGTIGTIEALTDDQDEADYAAFAESVEGELERAETNALGEETDEDASWWMRVDPSALGEASLPIDDVDLPAPPGVIAGVTGGRGRLERRLLDVLESPAEVQCSCGHDCAQREQALAALIGELSASESRTLHLRLTLARRDDAPARAFTALPAEHRARVLELLDRNARRPVVEGPNWRVVRNQP